MQGNNHTFNKDRPTWCHLLYYFRFTAQHVSNVSTSIFRSLRLIVDLFHVLYCSGSMRVGVTVWFGWGGEQYNTWNKSTISRKLLKMDVLTFETCWAVNGEIIKRVTSRWSIFIQIMCYLVPTRHTPPFFCSTTHIFVLNQHRNLKITSNKPTTNQNSSNRSRRLSFCNQTLSRHNYAVDR